MASAEIKKVLESSHIKETFRALRVLCGPMRYKIIVALRYSGKKGMNVTELADLFNASLSRVSHQLAILKRHKLIEVKGINRERIYTLRNHRVQKLFQI